MWTDDDRDKAVALQQIEDDKCPGCGNPLSETTDFDLRQQWAADEVTCHACRVRGAHVEQRDRAPGEFVVVSRKDD